MSDAIWIILVIGAWFALQRWILPRAGVST
jgi:hypothetical protein